MEQIISLLSALNVAGVIAALASWRAATHTKNQLSNNHGSTVKDSIDRIEIEQRLQKQEIAHIKREIDSLIKIVAAKLS